MLQDYGLICYLFILALQLQLHSKALLIVAQLESWTQVESFFVLFSLFQAAGNAFCKAARLHMQLQNKHDCATSFIDAGNAYKKSDPNGKAAW